MLKVFQSGEELGLIMTLHVDSVDEAIQFINTFAPEHLVVYSEKARKFISKIRNVGVMSINTPSVYLDYVAGPSHVLPTNLTAKWRGLLTPLDFMKPIAIVQGYVRDDVSLGLKICEIERFRYHCETLRKLLECK